MVLDGIVNFNYCLMYVIILKYFYWNVLKMKSCYKLIVFYLLFILFFYYVVDYEFGSSDYIIEYY